MSFYILVPLTVVFLLAAGRRPSWAEWAICLGVLVLTLLPYFALDAANGFFNTRHLLAVPEVDPDLVAANEVTEGSGWSADRLILAIARLTGGRSFPEGTVPAVIASNPVTYWGATVVFNCGLVALASFAAWGMAAVIGRRTGLLSRGFGRTEWALVVALAIAIVIASKTMNNNQGRYLIALLMPALLLVGVGFRNLREAVERGKLTRIGAALAFLLVLGLVTKHGAIGYYYTTSPRESNSSYAVKRTIVEMLKSEFGWVAEDIDFKVALWHDGGRYKGRSYHTDENAALSYVARVVPDTAAQARYDGCAIVQTTERRRTVPPPSLLERVIADLPLQNGVVVDRVVTRGDVRVIGYRTDNSNCVRSFGNAYLPTPEERAAARVVESLPEGGHAADALPGGGTRLFARLPNGSPLALDMIPDSDGLRGLAASYRIERSFLESYRLRFSPLDGGPSVDVPGRYPLGRNGLYTPWRIGPIELPHGRYAVELMIDTYTERHLIARRMVDKTSGPYRILLAGDDRFGTRIGCRLGRCRCSFRFACRTLPAGQRPLGVALDEKPGAPGRSGRTGRRGGIRRSGAWLWIGLFRPPSRRQGGSARGCGRSLGSHGGQSSGAAHRRCRRRRRDRHAGANVRPLALRRAARVRTRSGPSAGQRPAPCRPRRASRCPVPETESCRPRISPLSQAARLRHPSVPSRHHRGDGSGSGLAVRRLPSRGTVQWCRDV